MKELSRTNPRTLAIATAISLATIGLLIFKYKINSENVFWGIGSLLFFPGLMVAAVVGGAAGVGTIHDPSIAFAWFLNCLIYFGIWALLRRVLKHRAEAA